MRPAHLLFLGLCSAGKNLMTKRCSSFTDTRKDEKWLVLVGRPSLAVIRLTAGRPPHCTEARPTELFSYKRLSLPFPQRKIVI